MRAQLLRRVRVAGPALAAGVAMALSLPPFGLWVLAAPAAALLWWRLDGLSVRQRLLAGWAFGLGLYVVGLWWVTSFNVYGGIALMVVEALAPALGCALCSSGRGRGPALAGTMVLAEAARSAWPFGGLPLGGVALGQASGPLADAARLGGPLLLVGLVWLAGGGLGAVAVTALRWWRRDRLLRREPEGWRQLTGDAPPAGVRTVVPVPVARPVVAGALTLLSVVALGIAGGTAADGGAARSTLVVAAVQGGGQRGLRKAQVDPAVVFDAQVSATRRLAADRAPAPGLVVWPEDVVSLDRPLTGSAEEKTLSSLATQLHVTLLAGVTEPAGPGHFRNQVVAIAPSGRIVDRFEKVHRVPFGEYVPWRSLVRHLADLSAVPQDAIAGHGNGVLHTPAGALGTMVSYEVFFAARGRVSTRAGATLLVVPTNTSSYSTAQVPTQEIAAARLQALSLGRDLVQAAPTGFSALVDHDGRVLARSDLGRQQVVEGTLGRRTGRTIYERLGDLPVLLAAAVVAIGGWMVSLGEPSRARPRPRLTRHGRRGGP